MCAPEGEACRIQCGADTCRRGEYCYYTSAAHCMECEDESGDHNVCTRCHEPYSAVGGECVYLEQVALDALAWQLAFELTMPLTVKPDLAMTLQKMAELALQRAAAHDKNNRQRDELAPGKFLTARR